MAHASRNKRKLRRLKRERSLAFRMGEALVHERTYLRNELAKSTQLLQDVEKQIDK